MCSPSPRQGWVWGAGRLSEPSVSAPGGPPLPVLMPVSPDCSPDAPPAPGPPSGELPQPVQPLHVSLSAQHLPRAAGHGHCHQLAPHCEYGHIPCRLSGVGSCGPGCPQLELLYSDTLREIRWPTPELGGGQRVVEGCGSKVGRIGGNVGPSLICLPSLSQASPKLSTQQEAERQALQSLRQGGALTGKFMSTSSIPGCLLGVALEGDASPHGHASLLQHVLLLEQARQQSTLIAGEWAGAAQGRAVSPLPGL